MGSTDPAVRQPLRDEQLEWKTAELFYGTAATLWTGGGGAAAVAGAGALAATAALPVAILVLIAARAKYRDITIEHKLNDPPRFDFETATRARRRSFHPGALGDSSFALAAELFLMATLLADARLEASIRADERALGARALGHADLAGQHEAVARQFLREAAALQREIETTSINLSVFLSQLQPPPASTDETASATEAAQTRPLHTILPSSVLEIVRAAGMLQRDLSEPIARPRTGSPGGEQRYADEVQRTYSTDLGIGLMPVGLKSAESARTLRIASGPGAELPRGREGTNQELLEEVLSPDRRALGVDSPQGELPSPPEWRLDIESDADGYRWLITRPDGRVAGVSSGHFSTREKAFTAARQFGVGRPRFGVSEVSPGRFEWQARLRGEETVAFGRVPFSSRADAEKAMADVQDSLRALRVDES